MRSIVLEDNNNSLRYGIYTLIITTDCMNKRGIHCVLPRASPRCPFADFPFPYSSILLSFSSYYANSLRISFFFISCTASGFEPLTSPITLAYQSLYYTTILRGSIEIIRPKLIFVLLDSFAFQKVYITIYLFMCLMHVARRTKTCIAFVGPLGK